MEQSVMNVYFLRKIKLVFTVLSISCFAFSCATLDPQKVDVELPETEPAKKITRYYSVLDDLGLMTEIYDINEMKIQCVSIDDKTGASRSTQGEIPARITEMVKSTLNSIGGKIIYIPYDPEFIQNQKASGYAQFNEKLTAPQVILTGGITEFDRGLETRGGNTDIAGQKNIAAIPEWVQGSNVGLQYGGNAKSGLARITLDFNLLDFTKMIGIAKMNTVNSMEVGKAMKGKELAVSILGISFGRKGTIRKVQGRHEAVRLLVELSMVQIVGKYRALPYWRLLGDDAIEDKVVIHKLEKYYNKLTESKRIRYAQEYLFLHGYNVTAHGEMDTRTISALQDFKRGNRSGADEINFVTFKDLYLTVPINEDVRVRRDAITDYHAKQQHKDEHEQIALQLAQQQRQQQQLAQQQQTVLVESDSETGQGSQAEVKVQVEEVKAQVPPASRKRPSIGRILNDDEW